MRSIELTHGRIESAVGLPQAWDHLDDRCILTQHETDEVNERAMKMRESRVVWFEVMGADSAGLTAGAHVFRLWAWTGEVKSEASNRSGSTSVAGRS